MEELQILVRMVADLPQMALWVIVAVFAYKVVVVGSVYGVIRYVSGKIHDVIVTKKVEYKEIRPMLDGVCIRGTVESFIAQVHRIKGVRTGTVGGSYIHDRDVEWLREAIDEKLAKGKNP